jgi:hypothetical protein
VAIKDLKTEPGSDELVRSPAMQPYIRLAVAAQRREGVRPALEAIAALPLDKRYVWRIASALKWAFADYDSFSVAADRETMKPEEREKVTELLKFRPAQFCRLLKVLLGESEMERMMLHAMAGAKEASSFDFGNQR